MNSLAKNLYWLMGEVIKDIFKISLVTLTVFFLLETFEPGLISNHLSLNALIIFTLVFGIITAVWHSQSKEAREEEINEKADGDDKKDSHQKKIGRAYFQGFIFGLMMILLIGWQTFNLGLFGYGLPLLGGLIIILIFGLVKADN